MPSRIRPTTAAVTYMPALRVIRLLVSPLRRILYFSLTRESYTTRNAAELHALLLRRFA